MLLTCKLLSKPLGRSLIKDFSSERTNISLS